MGKHDYIAVREDDTLFDEMDGDGMQPRVILQRDYKRSTSECCGIGACCARCWRFLLRKRRFLLRC